MKPVPPAVRSRASWQRREHACQPSEGEGNACSIGWKMLQVLKKLNCDYLRQVAQPVEFGKNWLGASVIVN